jgi:hypothetical protein
VSLAKTTGSVFSQRHVSLLLAARRRFINQTHAVTAAGFAFKIARFIFAHAIQRGGLPQLKVSILLLVDVDRECRIGKLLLPKTLR